jgi:quinol monooxygenase YgiN
MVTRGLLAHLEAAHGAEPTVEALLQSGPPLIIQEPGTSAWFGIRFGRLEYGIFDVFPDDAARDAHLSGQFAQQLMSRADEILAGAPNIQRFDILFDKLPTTSTPPVTHGLSLLFKVRSGQEPEVEQFLRDAQTMVQQEPGTLAWFALHADTGEYGILDVFPDQGARFAHLTGAVPRALALHGLSFLGSVPDLKLFDVCVDTLHHRMEPTV